MTQGTGKYTGLCGECGRRRKIRVDGRIGPHPTTKRMDDCEGALTITNTEMCGQCRVRVGMGFAHKMDCSNPRRTPTGKDTR